jgi:hypothetical protein
MNLFFIPPLTSSILILLMGIHSFLKAPSSPVHRANLYLCLTFSIWLAGFSLMYISPDKGSAMQWARIGVLGIAFIPFNNCLFNFRLLQLKTHKNFLYIPLFFSLLISVLSQTPYIYEDMSPFFWGYYPTAGSLYFIVILNVIIVWSYGITLLYRHLQEKKRSGDWTEHQRTRYILIGWIGCLSCTVDFLPKFGIPAYPIGCYIAPYFIAITMIALTKHDFLVSISLLTRKILIVSGFLTLALAAFTTIYFLMKPVDFADNRDLGFLPLGITAVLGFSMYPLFFRFKGLLDRLLYPEYNKRAALEQSQINQAILGSHDNSTLATVLIASLTSYFQSMRISFYLWDENENAYLLQGSGNIESQDGGVDRIPGTDKIPRYFDGHAYLLTSDLNHNLSDEYKSSLKEAMHQLQAVLAVPIKKDRLYGILTLGQKESGLPYTRQEISDIKGFADLAGIAILHSLTHQDAIRDSLTHLYNRRKIKEILDNAVNICPPRCFVNLTYYQKTPPLFFGKYTLISFQLTTLAWALDVK